MKHIIILLFIWLFLTALGFGIGKLLYNSSNLDYLIEKGIPIYGKVFAKEPDNHQILRFSYEVNGKQYTGEGNAGRGNPDFEQVQIGQKVVVFYDPENPENSILGYPQGYSRANNSQVLCMVIFFPLIVILSLYRKKWILKLF